MKDRIRWFAVSLLGVAFCIVAGLALREFMRSDRLNVILLSVESTRAEAISPEVTPNIWRAAERGVRFTEHRAVSAWTGANMVSVLTGISPFEHGIHTRGVALPTGWSLPLKDLAAAGWKVAGLQPFMLLDGFQNLGLAIEPGVDLFRWLAAAAKAQRPFFLWYHYLDTHLPYAPSPAFMPDWQSLLPPGDQAAAERIRRVMSDPAIPVGSIHFEPTDAPAIRALYFADERQFDEWFAGFWDFLDKSGLRRNTVVMLTADHGDELLDHGNVGHASTTRAGHLHEELVHIPLILWLPPGIGTVGRVVNAPTDHLEIMPTAMRLLGVQPSRKLSGLDLLNPRPVDRPWNAVTSAGGFDEPDPHDLRHFVFGRMEAGWKLELWQDEGTVTRRELYRPVEDSAERHDLAAMHPDIVARLEAELMPQMRSMRAPMLAAMRIDTAGLAAPKWIYPGASGSFHYDDLGGRFTLRWTGRADTAYVVQYRAGDGPMAIDGELAVQGTTKDFGSIDRHYWNTWIVPYRHFRLRVGVVGSETLFTNWLDLEALP